LSESPTRLIGRELFVASLLGDSGRLGSVIHRVAHQMDEVALDAGDPLYRAGDRAEHFFFIVSGQVSLTRPGAATTLFGERSVVGSLDAMTYRPHTHTAVATTPALILRLSIGDWSDLLEDNFELARRVILRLATEVHGLRRRPAPLGGFDEPAVASTAPPAKLLALDRILHFEAIPMFARAGTQALATLARIGSTRCVTKEDVFLSRSEMVGQLVIIASGEVQASWEGYAPAARFGVRSVVGGAGALGTGPAPEVRATRPTRAIVLPLEDYFDVMEEHFDLARSALAAIQAERDELRDRGS
jgi:CRP-like cAMP-binding protein